MGRPDAYGALVLYSMRPPADIRDAFQMLMSGREKYLEPTRYHVPMAISILATAIGIGLSALTYSGQESRSDARQFTGWAALCCARLRLASEP